MFQSKIKIILVRVKIQRYIIQKTCTCLTNVYKNPFCFVLSAYDLQEKIYIILYTIICLCASLEGMLCMLHLYT